MRRMIVTGLGTGYLPIAPGTWGSGAVCLICFGVLWLSNGNQVYTTGIMAGLAVLAAIGCVALGSFAEEAFARKDPRPCTIDEWAGQALALCALPFGTTWAEWLICLGIAFFAFRFFDVTKLAPARQAERLPHGWGILADDLVAGVYANLLTQVALRLWTHI